MIMFMIEIPHKSPSVNVVIRYLPAIVKRRIYQEAGRRQAGGELGPDRGDVNAGTIISDLVAAELGVTLEKPPIKAPTQMETKKGLIGYSLVLPERIHTMFLTDESDPNPGWLNGMTRNQFIVDCIRRRPQPKPDAEQIEMGKSAIFSLAMPPEMRLDLFREAGRRTAAGELGVDGGVVTVARIIQEAVANELGFRLPDPVVIDDSKPTEILVRMRLPLKELMRERATAEGKSMNTWLLEVLDKRLPAWRATEKPHPIWG